MTGGTVAVIPAAGEPELLIVNVASSILASDAALVRIKIAVEIFSPADRDRTVLASVEPDMQPPEPRSPSRDNAPFSPAASRIKADSVSVAPHHKRRDLPARYETAPQWRGFFFFPRHTYR